MTVEASIIIPLMMFAFVMMFYMLIHRYDRTLLCQDTFMMTVYACSDYKEDKESFTQKADLKFSEIKKERPYLSMKDLEMNLSKSGNTLKVWASGYFYTPFSETFVTLFSNKDGVIWDEYQKDLSDPVNIMYMTKDFSGDK